MKKSTIEKIEKEINEKTKLPDNIKEKIKKEIFTNIVVASVIILYFIFIILGSAGSIKSVRTIDLNIFSILFLGIAISIFEISYRKDDGKLAMYGIESLIIAIFTLFSPYIIFELKGTNKKYYIVASICIAVYYILKSIIISVKIKNKYMNNNISDVKEIVKKEKVKRKIKEDIEEIEEIKREIKDDKKTNKEDKKITKSVKTDKTKAKTKKEVEVEKDNKNEQEESTSKKRGRPKKSETVKKENKPKEENIPKKRGRPRKVAINND